MLQVKIEQTLLLEKCYDLLMINKSRRSPWPHLCVARKYVFGLKYGISQTQQQITGQL